ncbi:hypothetical protein HKD37_07G020285 [Glycine soja]
MIGVRISLVEESLKETLLPSEKITEEVGIGSIKCLDAYELDSSMFNAKPKVFNSQTAAPQYKKLMDEITKYVIEDLYKNTVPEDFDRSHQVQSAKNQVADRIGNKSDRWHDWPKLYVWAQKSRSNFDVYGQLFALGSNSIVVIKLTYSQLDNSI